MRKQLQVLFACMALSGCCTPPEKEITVNELIKSTSSWDGKELPKYPTGQPEVTILRIEVKPGANLPVHYHPVINAGVLLKGELTVVSKQGEILKLKAGDPIIEVVDKLHYGTNEGDTTAEIIVFYAGTKDSKITIKE